MELKSSEINFTHLYKVSKIDIDKITFKRYGIRRNASITAKEGYEIVELDKEQGEETHIAKPEIVSELAGNVGMIIKGFKVKVIGKSRKKVMVDEIEYLGKE